MGQLEAPKEGVNYHVFPKDGEPFYATCLKVDGDVWQFEFNEPADTTTRKVFLRDKIKDYTIEEPAAVQERFDRYYTENGFVKVPTPTGWIQKQEYEFAKQAREDAATVLTQRDDTKLFDARAARFAARNANGDDAQPGALMLWGPQIALALGGLVLIGIIVKLVILGGEQPAAG